MSKLEYILLYKYCSHVYWSGSTFIYLIYIHVCIHNLRIPLMLFLLSFWFASHVDMREDLKDGVLLKVVQQYFFHTQWGRTPIQPSPRLPNKPKTTYRSFLNALCRDVISHTFKNSQENPLSVTEAVNPLSIDPNERVTPSGHTQHNGESSIPLLLPWIVFKYLSYRWPARQPGGDWDWGDPPSPHVLLPLSPNQTHPPTSQGAQSTPGKIEKNWTYLSLHLILT